AQRRSALLCIKHLQILQCERLGAGIFSRKRSIETETLAEEESKYANNRDFRNSLNHHHHENQTSSGSKLSSIAVATNCACCRNPKAAGNKSCGTFPAPAGTGRSTGSA